MQFKELFGTSAIKNTRPSLYDSSSSAVEDFRELIEEIRKAGKAEIGLLCDGLELSAKDYYRQEAKFSKVNSPNKYGVCLAEEVFYSFPSEWGWITGVLVASTNIELSTGVSHHVFARKSDSITIPAQLEIAYDISQTVSRRTRTIFPESGKSLKKR